MKPPRAAVTYDSIRQAALSLPGVEEGTAWGFPAFRTRGKLFLCFRQDLASIVVRASFDLRDEMIAADPATYYTTDHHRNYPWVLARLSALHSDAVPDLLHQSWRESQPRKRVQREGLAKTESATRAPAAKKRTARK